MYDAGVAASGVRPELVQKDGRVENLLCQGVTVAPSNVIDTRIPDGEGGGTDSASCFYSKPEDDGGLSRQQKIKWLK